MKRTVLMIATVAIFVLGTSFSANNGGVVKVSPQSDNTCTVIVKYSSGSVASSINPKNSRIFGLIVRIDGI